MKVKLTGYRCPKYIILPADSKRAMSLARHHAGKALVDPLCDAGTFPIEGALLASRPPQRAP